LEQLGQQLRQNTTQTTPHNNTVDHSSVYSHVTDILRDNSVRLHIRLVLLLMLLLLTLPWQRASTAKAPSHACIRCDVAEV